MGTEGEAEKRDWYGAKDECNNFAVGAVVDLASIHNSREDAFITTMLADLPADEFSSFWIGAGIDLSIEGKVAVTIPEHYCKSVLADLDKLLAETSACGM